MARPSRPLTIGEIALARTVFGDAVDYARVKVRHYKWIFFQPRRIVMAPMGDLHFHPKGGVYCDDFSCPPAGDRGAKGLFIHEMTHVWQTQARGDWYLLLHRHPWCRYEYSLRPGWKLEQYGIEQQAEIVRHAFLLRQGVKLPGVADPAAYELLVNFSGAA